MPRVSGCDGGVLVALLSNDDDKDIDVVVSDEEKANVKISKETSINEQPIIRRVFRPRVSTITTEIDVAKSLNRASKTEVFAVNPGIRARIGVAYDKTLGCPVICCRTTKPNPARRAGRKYGSDNNDNNDGVPEAATIVLWCCVC